MDFCAKFSPFSYCEKREMLGSHTHNRSKTGFNYSRVTRALASTVYKRDLLGHYGCVNAIEFSSDGRIIASGGDDRRLLLWDLWKTMYEDRAPVTIETPHISNINSCCFDNLDKKVATGGNDGQVIVHDMNVLKSTSVYGLSDAVYCISPDPINSSILATASDEGKVQILDTRTSDDSFPVTLADTGGSMHSVMYNSAEPRILATANSKHGVAIWDIRMPLKSLNYKSSIHNCMSVRFNSRGDKILALRRRAPPVLYDIAQTQPIHQFDHDTYYNACTLKSGCFAGLQDEFIVSGSDDFCVYLWKIPDSKFASFTQTKPYMILKGHRSIVNQVRFCHHNQMLISSGVEKLIKLWTPYPTPECQSDLKYSRISEKKGDSERNAYSHEEYIHMVLRAGSFLSHDYTNGTTDEEPCMIAFFDSLIQREVEQSESEGLSNSSTDSDDGKHGGERLMDQSENSMIFGVEDEEVQRSRSNILRERLSHESSSNPPLDESQDRSVSLSSRSDEMSRLSYVEYESSSDSGSEVDEILSAMYNRYMHSRERLEHQGPTGKKISSVITQGKYKDKKNKGQICKQRLQHIGENLQHSEDQYLRDNARNLSILADVIDNFVDNLVASDTSTSRSVVTPSSVTATSSTPSLNMQSSAANQLRNQSHEGNSSSQQTNISLPNNSQLQVNHSENSNELATLEPGRYFIPELEVFAPQSLQAVLGQEQLRSSASVNRQDTPVRSISRITENGSSSSTSIGRVLNDDKPPRKSFPFVDDSVRSPEMESRSVHGVGDFTDKPQSNGSSYANRIPPLKNHSKLGSSSGKNFSKCSRPLSNPSSSFSEPLSASICSTVGLSRASSSFLSSSSSSSSSIISTGSQKLPYSAKTTKSLVSPKLKLPKAKDDLNGKQLFPIKETAAFTSRECSVDPKEQVAFKKMSKSKKRRFRLHKISESCSSSDDECL